MKRHSVPALVLAATVAALGASAAPPPEDRCPTVGGPGEGVADDATPRRLQEGMVLSYDHVLYLQSLLPEEFWQNRHVFFYPGMRMVIGACHRVYPTPEFFQRATEQHAAGVALDDEGNLEGYVAGVPFPPEQIDPEAPDAAVRWAWNLEHRFRGAGPHGHFRIADIPSRFGKTHTYKGSFFFIQTGHRADLAASDYALPEAPDDLFIAGGRFFEPFSARHLAWRQIRPSKAHRRYSVSDETYIYVPTMRKVRRAATAWVDGMYVPRYRVAGDTGGASLPVGGGDYGTFAGSISPNAAESLHQTEHLRRGFLTISLRPNAYRWRLLGEREVLAPINSANPGFPIEEGRNYGPHGLSPASDRWDVRQAVVIEGRPYDRNLEYQSLLVYVDHQTRMPLFFVTKASRGRLLDVGLAVHRFSGDVINYPGWEVGERASVFDPVGEFFYRVADDSGWRRESFDARSVPAEPQMQRRFTSTDYLVRGR